jgi:hypothetical protein
VARGNKFEKTFSESFSVNSFFVLSFEHHSYNFADDLKTHHEMRHAAAETQQLQRPLPGSPTPVAQQAAKSAW